MPRLLFGRTARGLSRIDGDQADGDPIDGEQTYTIKSPPLMSSDAPVM
jgi:hypothetical protein